MRALRWPAILLLLSTAVLPAPGWAQAPTEGAKAPAAQGAPQKAAQVATEPAATAPVAAPAEKIRRQGLPNLGKVRDTLYRGGQPEKEGYDALRELGVDIVVNLRDNAWKDEKQQAESRGMRYVHIPWSGFDSPDNQQVADFLRLLRDNPDKTIFVHCRRGAERTGVMVSAFRIAEQGWTPEQALNEMEAFKFRGFWFRHLKNYVRKFPELLKADPHLKALASPQPGVAPATP